MRQLAFSKAVPYLASFLSLKLVMWIVLCASMVALFCFVVLVRITTPRFRLEALAKLGWAVSVSVIVIVLGIYLAGLILA